jgi:hypothetical protein
MLIKGSELRKIIREELSRSGGYRLSEAVTKEEKIRAIQKIVGAKETGVWTSALNSALAKYLGPEGAMHVVLDGSWSPEMDATYEKIFGDWKTYGPMIQSLDNKPVGYYQGTLTGLIKFLGDVVELRSSEPGPDMGATSRALALYNATFGRQADDSLSSSAGDLAVALKDIVPGDKADEEPTSSLRSGDKSSTSNVALTINPSIQQDANAATVQFLKVAYDALGDEGRQLLSTAVNNPNSSVLDAIKKITPEEIKNNPAETLRKIIYSKGDQPRRPIPEHFRRRR